MTVHIAGETLSLRTDRDEAYLQELADYVGGKVDELRRSAHGVPNPRIYLLVALQLADELYGEREGARALCDQVQARSERLLSLVESELEVLSTTTAQESGTGTP